MRYNSLQGFFNKLKRTNHHMRNEINYDIYRRQVRALSKDINEQNIYKNWVELSCGEGWDVQTEPKKGMDGKYHFIYCTEFDDDTYYIGKHSTDNLDDGYYGSGVELNQKISEGHTYKTTKLAFFQSSELAFSAEKNIVNKRMIDESSEDKVLNKVGGGEHTNIQRDSVKRGYTFLDLKQPIGKMLTFKYNEGIVCYVKDDGFLVTHNGKVTGLTKLARKYAPAGVEVKNPLYFWKSDGKLLSTIRDELYGRH